MKKFIVPNYKRLIVKISKVDTVIKELRLEKHSQIDICISVKSSKIDRKLLVGSNRIHAKIMEEVDKNEFIVMRF